MAGDGYSRQDFFHGEGDHVGVDNRTEAVSDSAAKLITVTSCGCRNLDSIGVSAGVTGSTPGGRTGSAVLPEIGQVAAGGFHREDGGFADFSGDIDGLLCDGKRGSTGDPGQEATIVLAHTSRPGGIACRIGHRGSDASKGVGTNRGCAAGEIDGLYALAEIKCFAANVSERTGKGESGQIVAPIESVFTNGGNRGTEGNGGQVDAEFKSIAADLRNTVADGDRGQFFAETEGGVADPGHGIGDRNRGQTAADGECVVADGCDGVGNCDLRERSASEESALADRGDTAGNRHIGDALGICDPWHIRSKGEVRNGSLSVEGQCAVSSQLIEHAGGKCTAHRAHPCEGA